MAFHSGRIDSRVRILSGPYRIVSALLFMCLLLGRAAAYSKTVVPAATPIPAAPHAQGDPQPLNFDACTIFSAADAAQILGVPVRPYSSLAGTCSYEAAKATSGSWHRNVALNVFKYKSGPDENSAWEDQKILRSLKPGRKNLTVLSGIGSEAYLQIAPDRGSFDAEVWVHKNLSHFHLIEVSEQTPSPDVLKAAAQKIAAKLP
jgi:hypothetical protein